MTKIGFEKATYLHKKVIFSWLEEPHIQEFWDNTPDHKSDILNFMEGRPTPSDYCQGKYVYWMATRESIPFGMLMTIQETPQDPIGSFKLAHLSKTGNTYGLDFMIGDKKVLGKGIGARTLKEFIDFFKKSHDPKAHTFLIDPATDNPKAKHVYTKAGFDLVGEFVMGDGVSGAGKLHSLLIKITS